MKLVARREHRTTLLLRDLLIVRQLLVAPQMTELLQSEGSRQASRRQGHIQMGGGGTENVK